MRVLVRLSFALVVLGATASAYPAEVKSVSRLTFAPDGTLFVADWRAAEVHAFTLPAASKKREDATLNVENLQALLSKTLGGRSFKVEDMAVRPLSDEVYLSLSVGPTKSPAVVMVTPEKAVHQLDLLKTKSTSIALKNAPTSNFEFWKGLPERSFTVTDMKWHEGELFVAGLSNQDFSSTLRRIPYPFRGEQSATSVEIFHTTHNQVETRAPVRAMTFGSWGGKSYLVAAYMCTPLVTIPLEDLKDGAHIRGKTIAELGYANTPADLISYTQTDGKKSQDMLLVVNYERTPVMVPMSQVQAADAKPGLEKFVPFGQIVGVEPLPAPLVGTTRIDNFNDRMFVVVRRELDDDALQLVTVDKGMQMRISDFVSEYMFPRYSYKGNDFQLKTMKSAQDMLMRQEDVADHIKSDN